MSADSPRRAGVHKAVQVVSAQPISDKSIIDSVAGIINDIVPQAYTSSVPNSENRESITWARFEYADVNDPSFYPDYNEGSSLPPLLLVLGYNTGVQVWLITASGEATEVLSWRQGMVRTLRLLPSPRCSERERDDLFKAKRPMVAICDSSGPGPQFCSVSFISLKTAEQVKSIKFKTPVCDVLANKRSIVVTFPERIAVFDAKSLEDVLTITTCYMSPGPNPNPVALGTRWLAYSEKKLIPSRRSSGGSEGEGVSSYTATVLYAAKSLGKGLRGLGESVASSLTGNAVTPLNSVSNVNASDASQPGVVTILDLQAAKEEREIDDNSVETFVAHFAAHSDAIVAMCFDLTGALLMTADKRGHDFHIFRVQPHPGGPSLAAVHHLYVLHRGDTTAKVQDMTFSNDARWAAVSTVRGTTHVFPVAPYGGPVGVRTHSSPHVVNRLSRFHKSAGLTDDGTRSHSPVSHAELPLSVYPYSNPRLPPYPHPTILHPLAQIRQPSSLNHVSSQAQPRIQQRQRLQSDDSITLPLKICCCFAPPRAWIYTQRDPSNKLTKRAVDSLFIMACHGNMIQYDLEPRPAAGIPKEKVCDETSIELDVEAKGQWPLLRSTSSSDIVPPLPMSSPLLNISAVVPNEQQINSNESRWLSQVEIFTHAGPHRRLWMGPQFVFKTYNAPSGVAANLVEAETVEIGVASGSRPARSNPVNMPHHGSRPLAPVVIDGSGSSYEQSPRFVEAYGDALHQDNVGVLGGGENQLREDLAEAMLETSSTPHRVAGRRLVVERVGHPVAKVVNPLGTVITVSAEEEESAAVASAASADSAVDEKVVDNNQSRSDVDEEKPCPTSAICAQEGKWPAPAEGSEALGCELREHTEICAEMRRTKEPAAIDSVPADSIEEVKEQKSLCAEARRILDLERVGASRDVPSSPILCAEQGLVPDCSNVIHSVPLSMPRTPRGPRTTRTPRPARPPRSPRLAEHSSSPLPSPLSSPLPKSSHAASLSSDDDIEHINREELPSPAKKLVSVLSSDDDIEHVLHSDVCVAAGDSPEAELSKTNVRKRSVASELQDALPSSHPSNQLSCSFEAKGDLEAALSAALEIVKTPEPPLFEQSGLLQSSQNSVKKTRMRPKRHSLLDSCSSNDMVEIINMDTILVESDIVRVNAASATPPLDKLPPPLGIQDMVEIINIDAETNSGSFSSAPLPDCKILMARTGEIVKKKSKRQKKQQIVPTVTIDTCNARTQQELHEPKGTNGSNESNESNDLTGSNESECQQEITLMEEPQTAEAISSWSSVVARPTANLLNSEEAKFNAIVKRGKNERKEEGEEEEEEEGADKENISATKSENIKVQTESLALQKSNSIEIVGNKEEMEERREEEGSERKSDFDHDDPSHIDRSSSLGQVNIGLPAVPMDTEEENCNSIQKEPLNSTLIEKNGSGNGSSLTTTSAQIPAKKTNRSKKKKRR